MTTTALLPIAPATAVIKHHPLCATVPGRMTPSEFDALCADIKAHGLREPITMYDGMILDGRERCAALVRLDIRFDDSSSDYFTHLGTAFNTADDARAFVISKNLHRRTLSAVQKGIAAARMALGGATQREACAATGVSFNTLQTALKLLKTNNTPLIQRAESGAITCPELEEEIYDAKGGNVVPITPKPPAKPATKAKARKPAPVLDVHTTTAVKDFKALAAPARKAFVMATWAMLAPAITAAGKTVKPAPRPKVAKPAKRR